MVRKWWDDKVAYQIYPKSFCDSNADGIGDLKGITSKLDYLKKLGIDIIWLSPVYRSPFVDQGYDISDYYAIAEEFGTMEDFDELLAGIKARGMHLIMDLVVNHCSDQHEWFQKALADPDGEYSEYFYFVKGEDGNPPSNSRSYFGGSIWEPVPGTDKFYLHMFAKEQPDLNWENPAVRRKIYDMVIWWLDKGLSGFRIDAIINIKKDLSFPSFPADGADGLSAGYRLIESAQGIGDFLQEMKHETFERYDAFTVGEVFSMNPEALEEFVGEEGHFSSMFDFSTQTMFGGINGWYDSCAFDFDTWRGIIHREQRRALGIGFLSNIIENHDEPRGATRYLPAHCQGREDAKKMLGTVCVLLRGIPFIYQGQELGMTNCPRADISEYDDISTHDQYQMALRAGLSQEAALRICCDNSRDNARTPMHWTDGKNAGFTTGKPWLALNPNYKEINVREQENRENSVLHYYRKLIALRKADAFRETFTYGTYAPVYEEIPWIMAYMRINEENGQRILVAANFGPESCAVELPAEGRILLENRSVEIRGRDLVLPFCGCVVMEMKGD